VCVGVMYSSEYDVCNVTLSVHSHRASWKVSLATVWIEPATFGFCYKTLEQQNFSCPKIVCKLRHETLSNNVCFVLYFINN
jgi:hypothetical protein